MKMNRVLLIALAVLSIALTALATTTRKVALMPHSATVSVSGPNTSVEFEAFCNQSPCNITWTLIESGSNVGTINNATGPTTTFTVGNTSGSAEIFASDDFGNTAHATITCQN